MGFAGERHGHHGAAVKRVFEADDSLALCVGARDLYRVFDRFRAAIHQNGFLGEIAGRQRIQFLRKLDVFRVGRYAEASVQKGVDLLAQRSDDARRAMADVEHADAAREIQEAIAVNVFKHGAFGSRRKDRRRVINAARHGRFATAHEFCRFRSRNRSSKLNCGHVSTSRSAAH